MERKPDCIFIGAGKSGSTWLWRCFQHHPQTFVHTETDSTRYYTIYYRLRTREWYSDLFAGSAPGQRTIEMCNDYMVDMQVPERIFNDNPNVKLIACLREPIERAYSHYWHARTRNQNLFPFEDILRTYMAYSMWLVPGFYADHLERYFEVFPRERMLILFYDELKADPGAFLRKIYDFLGVDDFEPPILNQRVNRAGPPRRLARKTESRLKGTLDGLGLLGLARSAAKLVSSSGVEGRRAANLEYAKGVPPELRDQLLRVTVPEVARLEKLLGVDLAHWKG